MTGFSKLLERMGVAMVFNTGRLADQRKRTMRQLTRAGFPVDGRVPSRQGRDARLGKQRCRDSFIAEGYTLIANVGNNDTDFEGGGYERAYRAAQLRGLRLSRRSAGRSARGGGSGCPSRAGRRRRPARAWGRTRAPRR